MTETPASEAWRWAKESMSTKPIALHVIERFDNFKRLEGNKYESGFWDMTLAMAQQLVGCPMYCHKFQIKPSFFGGLIQDCRLDESGEHDNRIIFEILAGPEYREQMAGKGGWRNDYKIVYP